jgi:hypothetical protein
MYRASTDTGSGGHTAAQLERFRAAWANEYCPERALDRLAMKQLIAQDERHEAAQSARPAASGAEAGS